MQQNAFELVTCLASFLSCFCCRATGRWFCNIINILDFTAPVSCSAEVAGGVLQCRGGWGCCVTAGKGFQVKT